MLNLNYLHVFMVLMQTRSCSRAAIKLGRSQSYVSKVLAVLRADMNDPLFIHHPDGLNPTTYALAIELNLKLALDQVDLAIEPKHFDPKCVKRVSLHLAEPYLIEFGKKAIEAIRSDSSAIVELRAWGEHSESKILEGEVDIGLHILNNKPQTFYQKKLHQGMGAFKGNLKGDYVKLIVPGVNDNINHFEVLDPTITPSIYIDNYQLMSQLMDDFYTLGYGYTQKESRAQVLHFDVALIMQASKRYSAKNEWLVRILTPIFDSEFISNFT